MDGELPINADLEATTREDTSEHVSMETHEEEDGEASKVGAPLFSFDVSEIECIFLDTYS